MTITDVIQHSDLSSSLIKQSNKSFDGHYWTIKLPIFDNNTQVVKFDLFPRRNPSIGILHVYVCSHLITDCSFIFSVGDCILSNLPWNLQPVGYYVDGTPIGSCIFPPKNDRTKDKAFFNVQLESKKFLQFLN